MRILIASMFSALSLAATAQQQQPQQDNAKAPPQNANAAQQPALTPKEEYRVRAEGAAGGTKPVPPEARKAVGAGAGPHEHFTQPSPTPLPKDEPVAPDK